MQDVKEEVRTTCLSLLSAKQTDVTDIHIYTLYNCIYIYIHQHLDSSLQCFNLTRCSALNILQLARWLGRPELKHVACSDCVLRFENFESMKLGRRVCRNKKTRKGSKSSMLEAIGFNLASTTFQNDTCRFRRSLGPTKALYQLISLAGLAHSFSSLCCHKHSCQDQVVCDGIKIQKRFASTRSSF